MSIHEDIRQRMRATILELDAQGVDLLSPTLVANRTYNEFGDESESIHIRYACIEHFKQMARRILGAKFDADGSDNPSHQGDMFSGVLQDRYPIPRKSGKEPVYKNRDSLTDAELIWNVEQLRKSAQARLKHADALLAFRDSKRAA